MPAWSARHLQYVKSFAEADSHEARVLQGKGFAEADSRGAFISLGEDPRLYRKRVITNYSH